MNTSQQVPIIEAHRGNSADYPENTLCAFRSAIELGVSGIELDIHSTIDGIFAVMHDAAVDRTTPGTGKISEMTAADVLSLDTGSWKGTEFAGETVPSLEQTLHLVAGTKVRLNIEVKEFGTHLGTAADLAQLLDKFRTADGSPHLVSSFNIEALLALRKAGPGIPLALLGSKAPVLDQAIEYGFPWVNAHFEIVDRNFVSKAHSHGLSVMIWTLDDSGKLAHFSKIGVDKVCTNCPRKFIDDMRENGK